jgi:hypothetical protein
VNKEQRQMAYGVTTDEQLDTLIREVLGLKRVATYLIIAVISLGIWLFVK